VGREYALAGTADVTVSTRPRAGIGRTRIMSENQPFAANI
jgi:hypothetical protein